MRALGGPQEDTWTASTGPDWSPHYHLSQPGTLQARLSGDALFPGPKPLLPLPRQQQIKRAGLLDFINVTYFSMPGRSFHLTRDTFFKLHVPSGSHMAWRPRTDWGLSGSMGLRSSPHFGGPGPPRGIPSSAFRWKEARAGALQPVPGGREFPRPPGEPGAHLKEAPATHLLTRWPCLPPVLGTGAGLGLGMEKKSDKVTSRQETIRLWKRDGPHTRSSHSETRSPEHLL